MVDLEDPRYPITRYEELCNLADELWKKERALAAFERRVSS